MIFKHAASAFTLLGFVAATPAFAFNTGVTSYHMVSGSSAGTSGSVAGFAASAPGSSELATSNSQALGVGANVGGPSSNVSTSFTTQHGTGFTTGTGLGVASYTAGGQAGSFGVTSFTSLGY